MAGNDPASTRLSRAFLLTRFQPHVAQLSFPNVRPTVGPADDPRNARVVLVALSGLLGGTVEVAAASPRPQSFAMANLADPGSTHRPDPNTYWVVEGRFLAGEYPRARDPAEARRRVDAFLAAGITTFIDLTEAHEPLAPYQPLLPATGVAYHRFAVQDAGVPASARQMADILATVDAALAARASVYVHCWGGIGRTGTVVACWLQDQGHSPDSALKELAARWQTVAKVHRQPRSPETDGQVAWVKRWPDLRATLPG